MDARWRRSGFSGGEGGGNGNCVEVALLDAAAVMRDSKNSMIVIRGDAPDTC